MVQESSFSAAVLILVLFFFAAIITSNEAYEHTIESLTKIREGLRATSIDNKSVSLPPGHDIGRYYHDSILHYEQVYAEGVLDNYTHGDPIIIYSSPSTFFHGTGNRLGDYFCAISCAETIGFHFIAIIFEDDIHPNFNLPTVRVGNNPPTTKSEGIQRLGRCDTTYPWQHAGPWSDHVPLIADIFKRAMDSASSSFNWSANRFNIQDIHEKNSVAANIGIENLPLIPNATIHLRCIDQVFFSMAEGRAMGVLNFNIYPLIIPKNVKYLYVVAEDIETYRHNPPAIKMCRAVSTALMEFLELHFPESAIAFHRGHHYESMYILYRSPINICSPSTFCLWPSLSKMSSAERGHAYLTSSWVVAGEHPFIHQNFHWISFPKVLSFGHRNVDMKNDTALAAIVKAVLTDPATDIDT